MQTILLLDTMAAHIQFLHDVEHPSAFELPIGK